VSSEAELSSRLRRGPTLAPFVARLTGAAPAGAGGGARLGRLARADHVDAQPCRSLRLIRDHSRRSDPPPDADERPAVSGNGEQLGTPFTSMTPAISSVYASLAEEIKRTW
jgi:hypothetical protein